MKWWERAAVAAWVEAEGSACIAETNPGVFQAKITLSSIDEEIIDWLISITGVGKKYYKPAREESPNPMWTWAVHRQNDFFELTDAILPLFLTKRKRRQVERVRRKMKKYLASFSQR
jgi:hypothetical protein